MDIKELTSKKQQFYAVIAEDASHSLSPFMHKIINKYTESSTPYYAISVKEHNLQQDILSLMKYAKGLNVTIPYKSAVLPYLDRSEQDALAINAVNTIAKKGSLLYGFNTDILGFKDTLAYYNIAVQDKKAVVLGSGGVSKAIAYTLLAEGATVYMASRQQNIALPNSLSKVKLTGYNEIDSNMNIIINGTPVGMARIKEKSLVSLKDFSQLSFVLDSIYTPFFTPLLRQADSLGIPYANGLFMLLAQGVRSRSIWGDAKISLPELESIFQEMQVHLLSKELQKSNIKCIALGGFMGVGKTFIGKELAAAVGYKFIDLDKQIEDKYRPISEIFACDGEEYFRQIEEKELKSLELSNVVISLGGGILASDKLASWLKERAFLINIQRPFEDIVKNIGKDTSRPLAANHKDLEQLYYMRKEAYKGKAHINIEATMDVRQNIIEILKRIIYAC